MTTIGHTTISADTRRRQIRAVQLIFAGAATVATLALFSAAPQGEANAAAPSGPQYAQLAPSMNGSSFIAVDDDGVNDQGQTSGDTFTQNAQDQSTASGAGTS